MEDPAFPLRPQLLNHFKGAQVTHIQQERINPMKVRINAESIFGEIKKYFKFLDFAGLQLQLGASGKMYLGCAILQNAYTCLYGNKISKYFEFQPVHVADYFR